MRAGPRHQDELAPVAGPAIVRRQFLAFAAAGVAALAASCSGETRKQPAQPVAPSGGSAAAGTPTAAPSPEVQRFLALAALLTGVPQQQLDSAAGQRYLTALQTPPVGGMPVDQLEQAAGVSGSVAPAFADLTSKGVLATTPAKTTAQAVAELWYSGQVPALSGSGSPGSATSVVAYANALGWKALTFAGAPGTCGGPFGFWSARPSA